MNKQAKTRKKDIVRAAIGKAKIFAEQGTKGGLIISSMISC